VVCGQTRETVLNLFNPQRWVWHHSWSCSGRSGPRSRCIPRRGCRSIRRRGWGSRSVRTWSWRNRGTGRSSSSCPWRCACCRECSHPWEGGQRSPGTGRKGCCGKSRKHLKIRWGKNINKVNGEMVKRIRMKITYHCRHRRCRSCCHHSRCRRSGDHSESRCRGRRWSGWGKLQKPSTKKITQAST